VEMRTLYRLLEHRDVLCAALSLRTTREGLCLPGPSPWRVARSMAWTTLTIYKTLGVPGRVKGRLLSILLTVYIIVGKGDSKPSPLHLSLFTASEPPDLYFCIYVSAPQSVRFGPTTTFV
jgi:hypothetical protein